MPSSAASGGSRQVRMQYHPSVRRIPFGMPAHAGTGVQQGLA